jgi:transcriptional regulator with XRE-family HTH domain
MKLDPDQIKKRCKIKGLTLQELLESAAVSRTAYYSLARKDSVLPASLLAIAGELGVAPSAILREAPAAEWRTRALIRQAIRVVDQHPQASFENVWHTLVLLEEPPVDRLRRSLLRGRAADLH